MYEIEILDGLKPFAINEIMAVLPNARIRETDNKQLIWVRMKGDKGIRELIDLRTVVASHEIVYFEIPRPKAILGHEHLTSLLEIIEKVLSNHPADIFKTFTINAAGRDSEVFQRLAESIAKETGLTFAPDEADLHLRVRPSITQETGWEVLVRLTPRPSATRPWRVADFPGAVNASVAATIVQLTDPKPEDHFLNLMCGSATLLIERVLHEGLAEAIGVETDDVALAAAKANITAADLESEIEIIAGDATHTKLPDEHFNVIVADPPWGQLIGSPAELAQLYAKLLDEIYRVAKTDAQIIILTHAVKIMETALEKQNKLWTQRVFKIKQGGLHPRVYVLTKL